MTNKTYDKLQSILGARNTAAMLGAILVNTNMRIVTPLVCIYIYIYMKSLFAKTDNKFF